MKARELPTLTWSLPCTVSASVITGECRNLDFRPSFGLTSPPTAETADSEAKVNIL
ncbi:hypothetical protein PQG02_26470 [Nostoc sp. UHCC 0926]|nr:hypothetical protein PQG02_26470 [Nostoc sp. UHCC 0926]